MTTVFSSPQQLHEIGELLRNYLILPFSAESIPGAYAETALARVRDGEVLATYDFVDVLSQSGHIGWQVKSTKEDTPVTWKRASLPNAVELIEQSKAGPSAAQALGNAVIDFCNQHVRESVEVYSLDEIGYAWVILRPGEILYFERLLVDRTHPDLFDARDFEWRWSEPKRTSKKEQLPALHGFNIHSGQKWWAAHLLGENQLHFSGERAWWPPAGGSHSIAVPRPSVDERMGFDDFMRFFAPEAGPGSGQAQMIALAELSSALAELLQVTPGSDLAAASAEMLALALRASVGDSIARDSLVESAERVYAVAESTEATDDGPDLRLIHEAILKATEGLLA